MPLIFPILTLALLCTVTFFAQSTGLVVSHYYALIIALTAYVAWRSRKQRPAALATVASGE